MKKTAIFLLLFTTIFNSKAYNGAYPYTIPVGLQTASFTTNNCKLAIDNAHKLLLTSTGAGLLVFDGTNYSNFNTSNSGIFCDNTKDIAVDGANKYFVASDSGMSVYNGAAWTNYSPSNSAIVSKQLKTIYTKNNVVYVGGNNGFSIFNNGSFTNFNTTNSALSNDTINAFAVDANNDVWIATNNGLCKWNGSTMTVFTSSNSSLPFNKINSLLVNGSDLWLLNSGVGISRMRNTSFTALPLLANTALSFSYNARLSAGPKGGVLFVNPNKSQVCEFYNNRIYTYFVQTSFSFATFCAPVFDVATNKLWLNAPSKRFASLDFTSYQNTLASSTSSPSGVPSITAENCQSLDVNQVKSAILNLGDMCWDGNDVKFEVPKGSGKHAIFANSLWIGGLTASGNLRVAAQTYRQTGNDFWPGPLDTVTGNTDTAKAAQYNRIWKITRQEIEDFKTNFQTGAVQNGSFIPAEAILSWPASETGNYSRKMAPYVDANNDGVFNPLSGGDYPIIRGDQQLYWIFNDNLAYHTESGGTQLKVEVHAAAYAFNNPALNTADSLLNYTTFYHYEIINRSNTSLDSCYLANWTDFDLGNYNDDFFGSIPARNTVYCYNSDADDEGNGTNHYGTHPPIVSVIILNGPAAYLLDGVDNNNNGSIDEPGEKNRMTHSIFNNNDFSLSGNPVTAQHYYNYLTGKWKDNSLLTYGGNGYGGTVPQKFIWPDYPSVPSGWHQSNISDGRMIQSCGPFHFGAGASVTYDFAFIFSQDTTLAYNSAAYYNHAANDAQTVENWFNQNSFPSNWVSTQELENFQKPENKLLIFPNPAGNTVQIEFENKAELTALVVFDGRGKRIKTSKIDTTEKCRVQVDLSDFVAGIYLVQAKDKDGKNYFAKFVKSQH